MTRWLLTATLLAFAPVPLWADEEAAGVTQRVTVRLSEYRFEPAKIVLKAGGAAELTFLNEGTIMHEVVTLALHDQDVDIEINGVIAETMGFLEFELPPKSRATLRFTPEKAGEFPFTCQAKEPKDHFKEGMAGTLIIK
jgi:plastocyanin